MEPQVESEVPIIDETNGYGAPCLLSYGTHVEDQVEQRLSQLGFNDHLEAPFSADRVARVCGRWATEKGLGYLVMGIDDGQSDSDDDLTYEAEGSDDEIETQVGVSAWICLLFVGIACADAKFTFTAM